MKQFWTANDLARRFRCKAQTIRVRARKRRIKAADRIDGKRVWSADQVDRFAPGPTRAFR